MDKVNDKLLIKVRGWIDDEDFSKLVSIARYLGRNGRYSYFKLDLDVINSKSLNVDDVVDILESTGAEYSEDLIEYLKSSIKGREVILSYDGSNIIARFNFYLGSLMGKLRDVLTYRRELRAFIAKPFKYKELLSRLKGLDLNIRDETGFKLNNPLGYDVRFTGLLRDYQEEALRAWKLNNYRGIIALPTGSGKTVIAIAALASLSQRTLIVAYTKEQLHQWRNSILKFTNIPEYLIGMYYSEEKRLSPVTLTTYQTAYRYVDKFAKLYTLLIVDEVHHLPADKFKFIAEMLPAPYRLGLSATPYREDGKHTELFPLMGGVVYYKSPSELAKQGYLAEYKIVTLKVNLKPDELRTLNKLRRRYRELVGYARFEDVLEAARRGDEKAIEALRLHNSMNLIIHKSRSKVEKAKEIIERELSRGSKIIVFAHYVDLAKQIAKETNAYLLTGDVPADKRKYILNEFKKAKSGVLVVTTLGDEGLDIPDANIGVLVAGTGSRRQFIQRLGRLLRPANGKVAVLYEIVTKGTVEELQSKRRKDVKLDDIM